MLNFLLDLLILSCTIIYVNEIVVSIIWGQRDTMENISDQVRKSVIQTYLLDVALENLEETRVNMFLASKIEDLTLDQAKNNLRLYSAEMIKGIDKLYDLSRFMDNNEQE